MNKRKILLLLIILITIAVIAFIIVTNPKYSLESISINQNNWDEIISTRTINDNVSIKKIEFNDYSLIIDEDDSTIYYSIINESDDKYTPYISYKTSVGNYKLAFLNDEINKDKVLNNYDFKFMIYNETNYRIYTLKCTSMPTLNITYDESSNTDSEAIPVNIYLFDNLVNSSKRITLSSGKINNLKDGKYSLKLNMQSPGKNTRKNSISIFNMSKNNEYRLVPADEESVKQGVLGFKNKQNLSGDFNQGNNSQLPPTLPEFDKNTPPPDLPTTISGDEVKQNKRKPFQCVELFINSEYMGLYELQPN